ncbi:hypothetical protein [Rhizobium laguerreae]|uniref:hypothetical protein n=1 Tax=Rhizobium laguerreae TaxID=1076926 RepID=UPI00103FC6C0|nr:hypothetical protein [Rhizobium laguerreae]TBX98682.1 hypothetical protein E0J21_34405 [Rhizobium laguerreae]
MLYQRQVLDRSTGELQTVDDGDWITIRELGELHGLGRRQTTEILREIEVLQVETEHRTTRHRLAGWFVERGWGKRLHRKVDKYPFDVISPDGRKWIDELWPLAVEEIETRKTAMPVQRASAALAEFKKTRKEMTVQMEVCWLADHFVDLTQEQIAQVLSVSQPLVSRNLAIRKRQRDWSRALKCRDLRDQAPTGLGSAVEAEAFWEEGLFISNVDDRGHDRHIQKGITSSKMPLRHISVVGIAAPR